MKRYATMLSVAGSDSSGGAGIQADIKTASALGVYAMTAVTAITVQNTLGVEAVQGINPDIVAGQINAVYADIPPMAVKTGMLYACDIVEAVADSLIKNKVRNLIIDPVMVSTSGSQLIASDAIEAVARRLFPIATLVTPNVAEARRLTGTDNPRLQAEAFHRMGVRAVLLKGGDRESTQGYKTDYLAIEGNPIIELSSETVDTTNTHGTGCTLSSAITAYMALGLDLEAAVSAAKAYVTEALRQGADISVGHGHGPVNHLFAPKPLHIY